MLCACPSLHQDHIASHALCTTLPRSGIQCPRSSDWLGCSKPGNSWEPIKSNMTHESWPSDLKKAQHKAILSELQDEKKCKSRCNIVLEIAPRMALIITKCLANQTPNFLPGTQPPNSKHQAVSLNKHFLHQQAQSIQYHIIGWSVHCFLSSQ